MVIILKIGCSKYHNSFCPVGTI